MKKVVCWMLLSGIVGSTVSVQAQDPGTVSPSLATGPAFVWGSSIREHFLWKQLGSEAVDRLAHLYEVGIRTEVPAGYLRQHGQVGATILNVLGGLAVSGIGLAVAHDSNAPSPGFGYTFLGIGVTTAIGGPVSNQSVLKKSYREDVRTLEGFFDGVRSRDLSDVQENEAFANALIASIARILSEDKSANRWLEAEAPTLPVAKERLEKRMTAAITAGLLTPFYVYASDELPSSNDPIFDDMRAAIDAAKEARSIEIANAKREAAAAQEESRRIEREKAAQEKTEARERKAQARRDRSKN